MPFGWIVSSISRGMGLSIVPGLTVSLVFIIFVVITGLFTACILASHHKTTEGIRMRRLPEVAEYHLGSTLAAVVATVPQQLALLGIPIIFIISGGSSLRIIADYLLGDPAAVLDETADMHEDQHWILVFTAFCLAASLVRGYENLWYLSAGWSPNTDHLCTLMLCKFSAFFPSMLLGVAAEPT